MKILLIPFIMCCFYKPFQGNKTFNKVIISNNDTAISGSKEQYAYIKSIATKNGITVVTVDYVQFLVGDKAYAAAKKYGDLDTTYDDNGNISDILVYDGYYIVNENDKLRQFPLATNATILMLGEVNGQLASIKGSVKTLAKKESPPSLFQLTIRKNKIIKIEEIYLP